MNIKLHIAETVATIAFDRIDSSFNFFDSDTLAELSAILDELTACNNLTGLIIRSTKPNNFIAGTDLYELSSASSEKLTHLITTGQNILNRIEDLPIPTVATIHGDCIGSGFELALACDWRIASDSNKTKIGLPETQIGILPAWGGTYRLPELLGLQDALSIILSGKIHSANDAKRTGLIDHLVPPQHLQNFAISLFAKGKRQHTHNPITHNQAVAKLIHIQAQKDLLKKTRGLLPAPQAALDATVASIGRSRAQSQKTELETIQHLASLPQTSQLIRTFFLKQQAKKQNLTTAQPAPIHRAAIIGAGTMGSGIAYWLSSHHTQTILHDISPQALALGMKTISSLYAEAENKNVISKIEAARGLDRIHPTLGNIPLTNCDLIIESAAEQLHIKQEIFSDLSTRCRPDTILATNTSALPIHQIASSISHPERLIGLHFFNPVHRIKLVEVVRTEFTSDQTLATTLAYVRHLGKIPIIVKDSPGFLVNRILMPYLVEAASMFEQGGDPEEIDNAMLDFGMPIGPLRLLDEIGLDVTMHITQTLAEAFPDRMIIPTVVEKLLTTGHTGRKGKSGFYVYDQPTPSVNAQAIGFQTGIENTPQNAMGILSNIIYQEAQLCLNEGIAQNPDDIDLAMILATGFPPWRRGFQPPPEIHT